MQRVFNGLYEGIMIILVILTVMSIWNDDFYHAGFNFIVWTIFTIDFIIRIAKAKNKWEFLKKHPFLVIAIIPFDQFFQTARIIRVVYLFRVKTIAKYYVRPLKERLNYRSLTGIILALIGFLVFEGMIISKIEQSVNTIVDGFIVVCSQLLFFGRQLIVIEQSLSVFLLTTTSMLGIIIQGIALQWAFEKIEFVYKKGRQNSKDRQKQNYS